MSRAKDPDEPPSLLFKPQELLVREALGLTGPAPDGVPALFGKQALAAQAVVAHKHDGDATPEVLVMLCETPRLTAVCAGAGFATPPWIEQEFAACPP